MPRVNLNQFTSYDEISTTDRRDRRKTNRKPKRTPAALKQELAAQVDRQESFDFSYNASRHEREWIVRSLGGFYENHWIDDVLRLVKGGKEASVYLCAANPSTPAGELIAAKVYRPRMFRNLKKDHLYREGRADFDEAGIRILDDGMLHAMHKRTAYGLDLLHGSWIQHEFKTLQRLHAAGVDVPIPYACDHNAILMAYLGDSGMPAPTLNTVELEPEEAKPLFERVVRNIDLMLAQECIHGDLSAYNILYWEGDIRLIDFPQAVHPDENRAAYRIFERDVRRVCEYFIRQGVPADAERLAAELWTAHGYRLREDVDVRLLEDPGEE
jgi:RIO kinase 1